MSEYGNDSIRSLSDREAVRMRVATYAGGNDKHGAFTTAREILSNSTDEFKAGHGNEITIQYFKDNSIKVSDKARGCPVDWNEGEGKYNYELIYLSLNAGGKYSQDSYEYALGLNGIGSALTILSSEFAFVEVVRDGYKYNLEFKKGELVGEMKKEQVPEGTQTGTVIHWRPDLEVFLENNFPEEWFTEYLEQQAIVNKGLKFIFINQKEEQKEFYYENGIVDYLNKLNEDKNFTDPIYLETEAVGKDRDDKPEYRSKYQIAFSFNNEVNILESYHNSSFLKHGGSPHNAVKNAFTYAIDHLIKSKGKYNKNEKKITFEHIADSLVIVTNTYSTETSYQNQTKFAITNKFIQDYLTKYLKEQLEIYFIENPFEADKIVEQILINKHSSEKAERTRLDIKKKLQSNSGVGLKSKIEDLNDCDMDNTSLEERELWVCEGESACQTMTNSRDDRTMGTYPLRGRFISSLKNSVEDVLNNKPAMGIIQSLGCGIEIPAQERKNFKNVTTFNKENLRYGNIVIACDSDSFGNGISIALVTFFYKFMPTLLKENRIHISLSPRYKITVKDKELFAYDEKEKNEMIKELDSQNMKYNVGIIKGLGELNGDTYWNYVMNPETRKIKKLIYKSEFDEQLDHYFNILMGEDIEGRKNYIKENITHLDLTLVD
ncbi:toprim domain-containing protein [Priestia megaterium]|uniref:toprim domain-containing protein n=1 Tax=Priestia megaterium TaxID=1404 RepID=UPI002877F6C4|nr:toprim domain-containing protein [Priestia megaterium]